MKREFKQGDRVLVRKSDLNEWVYAEFEETDEIRNCFVAVKDDGFRDVYTQCRHIDDFRTHDKVQVRDRVTDKWQDATYAVYLHNRPSLKHCVFHNNTLTSFKSCRWHPSLPWAEKKEPLTLEQRVEALERKLNER